jgi:hypothetical protein
MPLFDGYRDGDFFRKMNMELINKVINTEVALYQLNPDETTKNSYDESINRVYYSPIKINCLIDRNDPSFNNANGVGVDFAQTISFSFLYDELENFNFLPSTGDIVEWDNDFYELGEIFQNEYFSGKNPKTHWGEQDTGYNVSILCKGYKVRYTQLNIKERTLR